MEYSEGIYGAPRRQRASKACIRCNIRKVRCDVSREPIGSQCTNCRLDNVTCVIRPRARQRQVWHPAHMCGASVSVDEENTRNSTHKETVSGSPGLEGHLVFSYFSFITLECLTSMSPDVVNLLERNGSLHVPTRPVLDMFVREYFTYTHPTLPLLDEGQFWRMYRNKCGPYEHPPRISLFLFQAMLFAASSVKNLKSLFL